MSKEFICPSCTVPMKFAGGESIFQTCKSCHAPIIVPSEFLYKKEEQLASVEFASLVKDIPVDVEQVTNELTPGKSLPKDKDSIDPEARIEKFEVYQEKIGTGAVETKKAVDEIVAPKKNVDFMKATPYAIPFEDRDDSISIESPKTQDKPKRSAKIPINPVLARVRNELDRGDKIEAIKIFRSRFNTGVSEAKDAVEALERGEQIDISDYQ